MAAVSVFEWRHQKASKDVCILDILFIRNRVSTLTMSRHFFEYSQWSFQLYVYICLSLPSYVQGSAFWMQSGPGSLLKYIQQHCQSVQFNYISVQFHLKTTNRHSNKNRVVTSYGWSIIMSPKISEGLRNWTVLKACQIVKHYLQKAECLEFSL